VFRDGSSCIQVLMTLIAMMHVVDKALGPRGFGPGSWTNQTVATKQSHAPSEGLGNEPAKANA